MMEDIYFPKLEKHGSIRESKIILHPESKIIVRDFLGYVKLLIIRY